MNIVRKTSRILLLLIGFLLLAAGAQAQQKEGGKDKGGGVRDVALQVLPVNDVVSVGHMEDVGTFPAFTLILPVLAIGSAEAIKHDAFNVLWGIVLLPAGLLIDYIFGEKDEDKS